MSFGKLRLLDELEGEMRLLQGKLSVIEQKKAAIFEVEGALRTSMQRVQNQIYRLKELENIGGIKP